MNQTISDEILRLSTEGYNLEPGALRDQFGPGPTLLVFLRHFG